MDTSRTTSLGTGFAEAFAAKDAERVREVVHPEIDFRGLTPNRNWEASGTDALVDFADREVGWIRVVCSGFRPI